jgi:ABC-type phosphate transport system substrate-binding protein
MFVQSLVSRVYTMHHRREKKAKNLPAGDQSWTKVSMLNSPGSATYPIASFTYLLLPKDMSTNPTLDQTKAKALVDFIAWAITDGHFQNPVCVDKNENIIL